jgi:GDPmannose 4,6-dehydratase
MKQLPLLANPLYQIAIGTVVLRVDPYYRPTEVDLLIGDPVKTQLDGNHSNL